MQKLMMVFVFPDQVTIISDFSLLYKIIEIAGEVVKLQNSVKVG